MHKPIHPLAMQARGNALFLILIAVALFAALSFAVTQSSRGSGDASKEGALIKSARMTQYASMVRAAVQRMTMTGTTADQIILHNGNNWEPCTTGANCVFATDGGGVTVVNIEPDATTDHFGNIWNYFQPSDNISIAGIGTAAPEIVIARHLLFNARGRELCLSINKSLGIEGIPDADPLWVNAAPGEANACVPNGTDYYVYYMVVYES